MHFITGCNNMLCKPQTENGSNKSKIGQPNMDRFGQQMSQRANSSVRESCVCAIYSYFFLNFLAPKNRVSVVYPYERIQSHIPHTNQ